jgi:hypothetical protein
MILLKKPVKQLAANQPISQSAKELQNKAQLP